MTIHRPGRTRTCSINAGTLRSAGSWIADRRTLVERRLDRLGEYLASTAPADPGHTSTPPSTGTPPTRTPSREPSEPEETS